MDLHQETFSRKELLVFSTCYSGMTCPYFEFADDKNHGKTKKKILTSFSHAEYEETDSVIK